MEHEHRGQMGLFVAILLLSIILQANNIRADSAQLVVLASGQEDPQGIVISNGNVYWADAGRGTINKVPVEGGNVTVLVSKGKLPLTLAIDGDYVYWTDFSAGTVNRVPTTGGPVTVLATNQDRPWSILIADGYVYWAEFVVGNINRIATDGSGPIEKIFNGGFGVSGIAISGGYVYWAEGTIQGADVSRLGRALLPNGAPTTFYRTIKPWAILIQSGYLYWTQFRWGGVYRLALNGNASLEVIKPPELHNDDFWIAADNVNVYWTEYSSGNVRSAPLAGGTIKTLASNRTAPYDVASDGMHVVWTEGGSHGGRSGNVMMYRMPQEQTAVPSSYDELAVVAIAGLIISVGILIGLRIRHQLKDGGKR